MTTKHSKKPTQNTCAVINNKPTIQEQYILDNYLSMSVSTLSRKLNKSRTYVRNRFHKYNLQVSEQQQKRILAQEREQRSKWTLQMIQYLKQNYLELPQKTLARHIGISAPAVGNKMKQLNLHIPQEIKDQRKQQSYFKKGHISHNKGVPMDQWISPEGKKAIQATQFKKGNKPHNTKHNGAIAERPDKTGKTYLYIRISKSNWELLQRHVYRTQVGPLQDDEVVRFIDGNTYNCKPENLEKVSQKENMLRNSINRYGPEMAKAQRTLAKLKKHLTHEET